jgi:hypothetical protein
MWSPYFLQAWLSMDPYWQGEECLTVSFHAEGRYTRLSQVGSCHFMPKFVAL